MFSNCSMCVHACVHQAHTKWSGHWQIQESGYRTGLTHSKALKDRTGRAAQEAARSKPTGAALARWLLVSVLPIHQGCGFDLRPGHTQESTNERVNKWNNKLMFPSLSPTPSKNKKLTGALEVYQKGYYIPHQETFKLNFRRTNAGQTKRTYDWFSRQARCSCQFPTMINAKGPSQSS